MPLSQHCFQISAVLLGGSATQGIEDRKRGKLGPSGLNPCYLAIFPWLPEVMPFVVTIRLGWYLPADLRLPVSDKDLDLSGSP